MSCCVALTSLAQQIGVAMARVYLFTLYFRYCKSFLPIYLNGKCKGNNFLPSFLTGRGKGENFLPSRLPI